jgi:hypothetical protein
MTKAEKLNLLKTLLGDMVHLNWTEAKRKELISAAIRNGLEEKDTYVALKPIAKSGTTKGYYNIAEMTTLVEAAMRKLIEGAMKKSVPAKSSIFRSAPAKKAKKVSLSPEQLGGLREVANDSPSGKVVNVVTGGVYAFDALPYTQDDIDEELSLMNTTL